MKRMAPVRSVVALVLASLAALPSVAGTLELYLTSRNNNRVLRYDGVSGAFDSIFTSTSLSNPVDLTQAPNGDLYVANFGNGNVTRYDFNSGALLGTLSHNDLEETTAVEVRNGRVYALANDTHRVGVFDQATGAHLFNFGNPTIRFPHDFEFGPDGLLYITTEATGNKVQVWDPLTGTLVRSFGPAAELPLPQGLTFGPDGALYVSDFSTKAVRRYDAATGALLSTFTTLVGSPVNIQFGPHDGNLYVSTFGTGVNGKIERYDGATGAFMDVFIPGGGNLNSPRGFIFIPEPATIVLLGLGLPLLLRRR